MSDWFTVTPESERLLSEERLILAATEQVYEAMECANASKKDLAERLSVSKSEIGQRLSGRRNLTVRSLAAMLHVLGFEATLTIRPLTGVHEVPPNDLWTFRQRLPKTTAAHRPPYRKGRVTARSSCGTTTPPEAVAG